MASVLIPVQISFKESWSKGSLKVLLEDLAQIVRRSEDTKQNYVHEMMSTLGETYDLN